jgi:hypothetical protein
MIGELRGIPLLGCHVLWGAGGGIDGRGAVRVRLGRGAGLRVALQHPGDPEVGNLHPTVFVEQQVFRFDVAMHDPPLVGELKGIANRRHDGQGLLRSEPARAQGLPKIHAIHVFHEQEVEAACPAEIVNGDDVGVAQRRQRPCLPREPRREGGVPRQCFRKNLERNDAIELGLTGFEDTSHSALANQSENLQLRKRVSNGLQRWCGGPA